MCSINAQQWLPAKLFATSAAGQACAYRLQARHCCDSLEHTIRFCHCCVLLHKQLLCVLATWHTSFLIMCVVFPTYFQHTLSWQCRHGLH